MADTNVLKILRNSQLFATRDAALANIDSRAATLGDGEVWIATYGTTSSNAKSILAIKRHFSNGTTCVTKFDLDAISGEIEGDLYKYKMVALTAEEIAALPDANANVKEAYKVVSYQGEETEQTVYTQVGDIVKIYKDSSLIESYLGSDSDTINTSTGAVTKYAYELISDPTTKITAKAYEELPAEQKELYQEINSQSLNFVYQLADGTYTLTKVDVSKFLVESEFGNGLQVNGSGVVSVKVDGTSQDAENFISIGENGVKISGIQDAINASINNSEIVTAAALNDLEDRKADKTDLDTLEGNVLAEVNAGNGIDVTTKANSEQTVSVKLNTATDNALSLDTNGLYFSKTIDCGSY
jgi:hypothetical protein